MGSPRLRSLVITPTPTMNSSEPRQSRRRKSSVWDLNAESRTDHGFDKFRVWNMKKDCNVRSSSLSRKIERQRSFSVKPPSSESRLHLLEEHLRKHSWSNSSRHNICSICQSIMEGSFVKGTCH